MLAALLGSVVFALGVSAAPAWAQDEGIRGNLSYDDEPVVGAVVYVYNEDGDLVGSAESDEDGNWLVPVPGSASYRVVLDESTLPDGLVGATGNEREPFVRQGSVGFVMFPLDTGVREVAQPTPPPGGPGEDDPEVDIPADPEEEVEVIAGPGRWDRVFAHVYSGIHFGLLIALAALGLSLIFGTTGLINFSHGELVSFGAIVGLLFHTVGLLAILPTSIFVAVSVAFPAVGVLGSPLPLVAATPLAVAVGVLFGYVQDRFFWGWLRRRATGLIAMMIISIGAALLLRNLYLYFIGPGRRVYPDFAIQRPIEVGPLIVMPKTLITDGIALVVLIAVALALVLTRLGKATRAVADNPALAAASGINVDRIIRLVWAMGAGLAALAGVFLAMHETVNYLMGFQMLLLIFAAVIVGGLGTAFGAVVGGLIVGLLIQVSTLWVPSEFKYVFALALLIVVLLVRPQGILGRRVRVG
jgi:neutral amino acid transport system permease protein